MNELTNRNAALRRLFAIASVSFPAVEASTFAAVTHSVARAEKASESVAREIVALAVLATDNLIISNRFTYCSHCSQG